MRQLKITPRITQRDNGLVEQYFSDIGRLELLTPEEEVELAKRIKKGEQEAMDELVRGNLRFVASVAKQYQGRGLPLSDLINEGNLGLIKAAVNFDETKGFRFISYAVWWIRQSILRALESYARVVRLPSNKVEALNKVNKKKKELEQEYERPPTQDELAELLDLKPEHIKEVIRSNRQISIDDPVGDDEGSNSLCDLLENPNSANPDQDLMDESLKDEIRRVLSKLPVRQAKIIMYSIGLDGNGCKSPREVGEEIDLSRERVRQLKSQALATIKSKASSDLLKSYL